MNLTKTKKRMIFMLLFLIFTVVEVLIAIFIHDNLIRPYLGDMLVVIVIYFFVRIFLPEGVKLLPFYIFIFAAIVEVLQYFNYVTLLGLQKNKLLSVMLGSSYDIKDIICYAIGCILLFVVEAINRAICKL